jgi:hypothetical protein
LALTSAPKLLNWLAENEMHLVVSENAASFQLLAYFSTRGMDDLQAENQLKREL